MRVLRKFSQFGKNSIPLSFISLSLFVTTHHQNDSRTFFTGVAPEVFMSKYCDLFL